MRCWLWMGDVHHGKCTTSMVKRSALAFAFDVSDDTAESTLDISPRKNDSMIGSAISWRSTLGVLWSPPSGSCQQRMLYSFFSFVSNAFSLGVFHFLFALSSLYTLVALTQTMRRSLCKSWAGTCYNNAPPANNVHNICMYVCINEQNMCVYIYTLSCAGLNAVDCRVVFHASSLGSIMKTDF